MIVIFGSAIIIHRAISFAAITECFSSPIPIIESLNPTAIYALQLNGQVKILHLLIQYPGLAHNLISLCRRFRRWLWDSQCQLQFTPFHNE